MRSLLPVSLVAGVASVLVCSSWVDGAAFQRNSLSAVKTSLFGLGDTAQSIGNFPRGGEEEVVEEPETLYLPGLVDVEVKRSNQVRSQYRFLVVAVAPGKQWLISFPNLNFLAYC
jgi:hypothetical protein